MFSVQQFREKKKTEIKYFNQRLNQVIVPETQQSSNFPWGILILINIIVTKNTLLKIFINDILNNNFVHEKIKYIFIASKYYEYRYSATKA